MQYKDIDTLFTYHPAPDIDVSHFEEIRRAAKSLGASIIRLGRQEKDIERAIEKLRECIYYSIASIVVPKIGD